MGLPSTSLKLCASRHAHPRAGAARPRSFSKQGTRARAGARAPPLRRLSLLGVQGMLLLGLIALSATPGELAPRVAPPVIFWNSEGQLQNSTVLALGGSLAGASITVCDDPAHTVCQPATVLQSSEASIHFVLPVAGSNAAWFQACSHGTSTCSAWRAVNSPDVWWAVGDQSHNASATATPGGWLRVYGRAIGFGADSSCASANTTHPSPAVTGATAVTLTPVGPPGSGSALKIPARSASCYEATFAIPRTAAAGTYALEVTNGLPGARTNITHDLVPLSITLRDAAPWPTKRFHIAAGSSVQTITDALAAAAAAGGGVVALAAGTWDMKNTSLRLAHNVQLTGPEDAPTAALLHWTEPTTASLLSNANSSAKTRYAVRDLSIYVGAAAAGYVLDIGGHGVEIRCEPIPPPDLPLPVESIFPSALFGNTVGTVQTTTCDTHLRVPTGHTHHLQWRHSGHATLDSGRRVRSALDRNGFQCDGQQHDPRSAGLHQAGLPTRLPASL